MKKSELKALILECKQELVEEESSVLYPEVEGILDGFIEKIQDVKDITLVAIDAIEAEGGTVGRAFLGGHYGEFTLTNAEVLIKMESEPELRDQIEKVLIGIVADYKNVELDFEPIGPRPRRANVILRAKQ